VGDRPLLVGYSDCVVRIISWVTENGEPPVGASFCSEKPGEEGGGWETESVTEREKVKEAEWERGGGRGGGGICHRMGQIKNHSWLISSAPRLPLLPPSLPPRPPHVPSLLLTPLLCPLSSVLSPLSSDIITPSVFGLSIARRSSHGDHDGSDSQTSDLAAIFLPRGEKKKKPREFLRLHFLELTKATTTEVKVSLFLDANNNIKSKEFPFQALTTSSISQDGDLSSSYRESPSSHHLAPACPLISSQVIYLKKTP